MVLRDMADELQNGNDTEFYGTVLVGKFLESVADLVHTTCYHEASDHYPSAEEYRAQMKQVIAAAEKFIAEISDDNVNKPVDNKGGES